jgi:hypothetical protein
VKEGKQKEERESEEEEEGTERETARTSQILKASTNKLLGNLVANI